MERTPRLSSSTKVNREPVRTTTLVPKPHTIKLVRRLVETREKKKKRAGCYSYGTIQNRSTYAQGPHLLREVEVTSSLSLVTRAKRKYRKTKRKEAKLGFFSEEQKEKKTQSQTTFVRRRLWSPLLTECSTHINDNKNRDKTQQETV